MGFRDYYKTLGVDRKAGEAEIKNAYRKLARKFHPDVNPDNKDAEAKFRQLNKAYRVIGDPDRRKRYDQLGADWEQGLSQEEILRRYPRRRWTAGTDSGGGGLSDFFSQFFAGGAQAGFGRADRRTRGRSHGGSSQQSTGSDFKAPGGDAEPVPVSDIRRAPDLRADVTIALADAVKGAKLRLDLVAEDGCAACRGSGMIAREEKQGKARAIGSARLCSACGGAGVVQGRRTVEAAIPAGVADDTELRLKGHGGRAHRPDKNGDLLLTVRIKPNPLFALAGRDLRASLPVWDYEAALGAEITVATVGGQVSLKIPPGSKTGRVMRLRGRGLPARDKEPAGDLFYELKVLATIRR